MFAIDFDESGQVRLRGRLDAVSAPVAREFLAGLEKTARLDFAGLEYIASIGLGVLAAAQKRLRAHGEGLILTGLSPHLREVLSLAGFEGIFEFE